jgi:transposase
MGSCYGTTASTAKAARAKGIEIVESFFGRDLARSLVEQGRSVDLTAPTTCLRMCRTSTISLAAWVGLLGRRHPRLYPARTTTLFAALDIANGQVIAQCRQRHRHQEFLNFLKHVDTVIPADLDAHLVVDNYATHKHPKVRAWLAARPRFHVHCTLTYSSWLNQIERWFAILTERQIRRSSAVSAKDLVAKIEAFVAAYNAKARPFVWTAASDAILEKLECLCNAICGT